ncbi:MAG TPA: DUF4846 domain-containing protein [Polyangiaceae bacterium]|nr:DUF4846 domain-containing protein [Polyangiaceae bacterium]
MWILVLLVGCEPAQALTAEPQPVPAPTPTAVAASPRTRPQRYLWLNGSAEPLAARIAPPKGFERVPLARDSFGAFLRELPLMAPGSPVKSHSGTVLRAADHPGVAAVVDLDVGERDLQQCADAVMRLHAEWLLSHDKSETIAYHVSSGKLMQWSRWAAGERPRVEDQRILLSMSARPDDSRRSFRSYLDFVFGYAGTGSLAKYSATVKRDHLAPGDFFVLPGNPGHTVLVLDLARDRRGRTVALLGQSFMPAQSFHVLRAPDGIWFDLDVDAVKTPFWPAPFPWSALRRL